MKTYKDKRKKREIFTEIGTEFSLNLPCQQNRATLSWSKPLPWRASTTAASGQLAK
jgi:hypothetical protein